jgi:iron complex outermembrane recepter protein
MRLRAVLSSLVTLLWVGVASAEPAPEPCASVIDGHVVDSITHDPVAAATVSVDGVVLAESNAAGRFTLRGICNGEVTVVVERPDYELEQATINVDRRASLELELRLIGEMIVVRDKAPPPTELRSTTTLEGAALERTRGRGLASAVADVPGVAELRSATGMAKPIIRGQFGRRLLLLVDGIRHRAQEWGLEHAPEIDPFIADKIHVVRGAGGVRYGSDAIGGVVVVEPPELRREPGYGGELHVIGASNGPGATLAGRIQGVHHDRPSLSGQLEGSVKRLASAATPDYPLDNTGVLEWSAGATGGYRGSASEYKLSYRHYQAKLGVCNCLRIDSADDFYASIRRRQPVDVDLYRQDFAIDRPYQEVAHDLAIARARWDRGGLGTLTATYAFQHDLRREYDVVRQAVSGAQFNFRLLTHEAQVELEHNPFHLSEHWHLRGALGVTGALQTHDYAGLHLVPDHRSLGGGIYAVERFIGHDTDIEIGGRYDYLTRTASLRRQDYLRLVRSDQLAPDACPGDDPVDCTSRFHTFTASAGVLQRLGELFTAKLELSAAARAPNPDEQFMNGTAPTFPVLGLGKPDLGRETTYGTSLTVSHASAHVTAEVSGFVNRIDDYIYFAPAIGADGMPIFDILIRGAFPRFTTRPLDALFWGADGGIAVKPVAALELGAQASLVRARNVADGSYLVLVPSDRYRGSLTYRPPDVWPLAKSSATVTASYVTRQRRFDPLADFAPPPGAYVLVGAELATETCVADQTVKIALQGANLTNRRYRDYTSLLRYFADEPGWQLWLRVSVFFDSEKGKTR